MRKVLLFSLVFCIFTLGFSQNKRKDQDVDIINYQVKLGETVRTISKKYLVEPSEIYKLNKFAIDGISEGMVLHIPVPRKEVAETQTEIIQEEVTQEEVTQEKVVQKEVVQHNSNETTNNYEGFTLINHTVESKETFYGISKKYNVSIDEIKSQNEATLKNGLQPGQVLTIKKNN